LKVYIDRLNEKDMMCILGRKYKAISACELEKMVSFNSRLQEEIMVQRLSSCPVRGLVLVGISLNIFFMQEVWVSWFSVGVQLEGSFPMGGSHGSRSGLFF
jgi:hypothetical protein